MGLDSRRSRAGNHSRNKYYKGEYVDDKGQLIKDAIIQGIFYSTDYEDFTKTTINMGSIKKKQVSGKLVTTDYVGDLEPDDYVLYDGNLYVVTNIVEGDLNENKQYSTRPSFQTIISVRR